MSDEPWKFFAKKNGQNDDILEPFSESVTYGILLSLIYH